MGGCPFLCGRRGDENRTFPCCTKYAKSHKNAGQGKIRPTGVSTGGPVVLRIVAAAYKALTAQSSKTNEVGRDEFSVPVK